MITYRENDDRDLIPFEDSQPLCSYFRPKIEAQLWAEEQVRFSDTSIIFVLGLGAGFHVEALANQVAAQIVVLENRIELVARWNNAKTIDNVEVVYFENIEQCVDKVFLNIDSEYLNTAQTFAFRPAMGLQENVFDSLAGCLTGRHRYGLEMHMLIARLPTKLVNVSASSDHFRDIVPTIDTEKLNALDLHAVRATEEISR